MEIERLVDTFTLAQEVMELSLKYHNTTPHISAGAGVKEPWMVVLVVPTPLPYNDAYVRTIKFNPEDEAGWADGEILLQLSKSRLEEYFAR